MKRVIKRVPGFVTLTEHHDSVDYSGRPNHLFEGLPRFFPAKNFLGVTHGVTCSLVHFNGEEALWVRESAEKVMELVNKANKEKRK